MTYRGGRGSSSSPASSSPPASTVQAPTAQANQYPTTLAAADPDPNPKKRRQYVRKKQPPKFRFGCNRSKVFKSEPASKKSKLQSAPPREYSASNDRRNNRPGGKAMPRKTGTTRATLAGHDTCSCRFFISGDSRGYYFCCGVGSSKHEYHVPIHNVLVALSSVNRNGHPSSITHANVVMGVRNIYYGEPSFFYTVAKFVRCKMSKRVVTNINPWMTTTS
jgi:hypothetical protein